MIQTFRAWVKRLRKNGSEQHEQKRAQGLRGADSDSILRHPLIRRLDARIIDKALHRYPTCGDWLYHHDGSIVVRVSDLNRYNSENAVILHEFIEAWLCRHRGITDYAVIKHDLRFEEERAQGLHPPLAEPGEDERAPYFKEHAFATKIERMCIEELGESWEEHDRVCGE